MLIWVHDGCIAVMIHNIIFKRRQEICIFFKKHKVVKDLVDADFFIKLTLYKTTLFFKKLVVAKLTTYIMFIQETLVGLVLGGLVLITLQSYTYRTSMQNCCRKIKFIQNKHFLRITKNSCEVSNIFYFKTSNAKLGYRHRS